jgi:hypothetical protein
VTFDPSTIAKRALRGLLSEQTMGMIDYIRTPDHGVGWGPFMVKPLARLFLSILLRKRGRPRS